MILSNILIESKNLKVTSLSFIHLTYCFVYYLTIGLMNLFMVLAELFCIVIPYIYFQYYFILEYLYDIASAKVKEDFGI